MVNEDSNKIYNKESWIYNRENWAYDKESWVKSQQGKTNAMLADGLKESENQKLTTEEYFKDLEKTGKYPEELQKLIESDGGVFEIPDYLESQGVHITSPKEKKLWFLPKDKQREILRLSPKYFKSLSVLADYSWEWWQECQDGSDLYTLARFNWKIYLVKVAAWEFNGETFINGWRCKTNFNKFPFPLFVVNQWDSYLLSDSDIQTEIRNIDVRLYLDLFTKIASVEKWTAETFDSWQNHDKIETKFDWSQIKIPEYEELRSELSKTSD